MPDTTGPCRNDERCGDERYGDGWCVNGSLYKLMSVTLYGLQGGLYFKR